MDPKYTLGGGKGTLPPPEPRMPLPPAPFDENNIKYWCLFERVHIRTAARAVAVCLVVGVLFNMFFSLTRSPTVIVYSWVVGAFSVGVYGSLGYAVFKEKRNFTLPFLVFQGTFIVLLGVFFFLFILCAIFFKRVLIALAVDFGGVNPFDNIHDMTAGVRAFVVLAMILWVLLICTQCWYFEIIYRFYHYLEERETSFNFNLEPSFHDSV